MAAHGGVAMPAAASDASWEAPATDLDIHLSPDGRRCLVTPHDHEFVVQTDQFIDWTINARGGFAEAPRFQLDTIVWLYGDSLRCL